MSNNTNLQRFLDAQDDYYEKALSEIRNGRKESHWIWFIFPQLKGLGQSEYSYYYGIDGLAEAKEYLQNTTLKNRLIEISEALYSLDGNIDEIFGYPDTFKVLSSMTLFSIARPEIQIFNKIIDKF